MCLTGQESGHVNKGDDGNVEGITEPYEAGTLHRCVYVQAS